MSVVRLIYLADAAMCCSRIFFVAMTVFSAPYGVVRAVAEGLLLFSSIMSGWRIQQNNAGLKWPLMTIALTIASIVLAALSGSAYEAIQAEQGIAARPFPPSAVIIPFQLMRGLWLTVYTGACVAQLTGQYRD
jgi:hypothetical protein